MGSSCQEAQMHRPRIAELLLARFTTRGHAATMAGDLIEIAPEPVPFWLAVLHTTSRFAARPPQIELFFLIGGLLLSMIAGCSAVRRGPLDLVTKLAAALCAFASAVVLLCSTTTEFLLCGVAATYAGRFIPLSLAQRHLEWFLAIQVLAPAVAVGAALSWSRPEPPVAAG
jgi:hypothetical protein